MPHLDDYLQHLTFERGLSTNTLKSYTRDIQLLQGLAQESDLANIQNTQIRRFIATLHSRG
ncbi:MAG TPA: site-specific integrase, partial [Methylotenera sp.]|nr:site-specific integrase [Methylotenera sp.]